MWALTPSSLDTSTEEVKPNLESIIKDDSRFASVSLEDISQKLKNTPINKSNLDPLTKEISDKQHWVRIPLSKITADNQSPSICYVKVNSHWDDMIYILEKTSWKDTYKVSTQLENGRINKYLDNATIEISNNLGISLAVNGLHNRGKIKGLWYGNTTNDEIVSVLNTQRIE